MCLPQVENRFLPSHYFSNAVHTLVLSDCGPAVVIYLRVADDL